jgi:hypothetical protein
MAIDKSGTYWVGSAAADLDEYLRALTAESYPADRVVHARCHPECDHDRFGLMYDADQGCARRACARCRCTHEICDSDETWPDAEPETLKCSCGGTEYEIAVAFSHREDGSVKWITVGARCAKCGVLGSPVDWKIEYAPTDHLYAQV